MTSTPPDVGNNVVPQYSNNNSQYEQAPSSSSTTATQQDTQQRQNKKPIALTRANIATHRPALPVMPKLSANEDMERKKNEIVRDMLKRIGPFMNAQGHLRQDADFCAFADLMAGETHYVQKTLLLTVLLSATTTLNQTESQGIFVLMSSSDKLLAILCAWLAESIKQNGPLLGKLLELFQKLSLTVDQLVEHKLGKLVKKLLTTTTSSSSSSSLSNSINNENCIKQEIRDRAAQLCEAWTKLAHQEDVHRRPIADLTASGSNNSSSNVKKDIASGSLNEGDNNVKGTSVVVANMTLFNDDDKSTVTINETPTLPLLKTRAEQVLERLARDQTSLSNSNNNNGDGNNTINHNGISNKNKLESRPLSADDIRKAKKRQQYLQEAHNKNGSLSSVAGKLDDDMDKQKGNKQNDDDDDDDDNNNFESIPSPPSSKRIKKKRVSFANEKDLVKVHYFELPDDDYSDHNHQSNYTNAHEMERNEASFAFKQMALVMEAEVDWRGPRRLEGLNVLEKLTIKSEETGIQEAREQRALSAVYFSLDDIPPSPSEPDNVDDTMSLQSPGQIRKIPLKDVENRVSSIVRFVNDKPNLRGMNRGDRPITPPPSTIGSVNNPDLLSSLLQNPNALQDLLRNVPPVGVLPVTSSNLMINRPRSTDQPLQPRAMNPSQPPPLPMAMFPPLVPQHHPHTMPPYPMPFAMPPPRPMGYPPSLIPQMPSPYMMPPPVHAQLFPAQRPAPPGRAKTLPCKYYKKGKPGSCRYGNNCQFLHEDY